MTEPSKRGEDRRQFYRATIKTAVHIGSESNFYTGFTDDISEGGLFVATHNLLANLAVVDLEFTLPDEGPPIRVRGEVRWVREYNPTSDGHPGMGIRFLGLSQEDRDRIEKFVVTIRETLFFTDE
jgi:uncharacterized protein (TIGR02266 family)